MTSMTTVTCHNKSCKKEFQARTADVKRGWGKFCSKSCKAIEQENRTGQYKKLKKKARKVKNKKEMSIYDPRQPGLLGMLNRKVIQMENPINVEPKEDWDYDGPFDC